MPCCLRAYRLNQRSFTPGCISIMSNSPKLEINHKNEVIIIHFFVAKFKCGVAFTCLSFSQAESFVFYFLWKSIYIRFQNIKSQVSRSSMHNPQTLSLPKNMHNLECTMHYISFNGCIYIRH